MTSPVCLRVSLQQHAPQRSHKESQSLYHFRYSSIMRKSVPLLFGIAILFLFLILSYKYLHSGARCFEHDFFYRFFHFRQRRSDWNMLWTEIFTLSAFLHCSAEEANPSPFLYETRRSGFLLYDTINQEIVIKEEGIKWRLRERKICFLRKSYLPS